MENWAKAYRDKHGLSQQALADKIGCHKSLVCMFESGQRAPGVELLPTIRDKLGLRPAIVRPDIAELFRSKPKGKGRKS